MADIWWEQMTSAVHFIHRTADVLLSGKGVILLLPESIPWYDDMRWLIEADVKKHNSKNSFDVIDSPPERIGEYLLNRYCAEEKRVDYRPTKTYARFLAECSGIVLNDSYIWVRSIPREAFGEWIDFMADYYKNIRRDATPAGFILEVTDTGMPVQRKKGISVISYTDMVSQYDIHTFCAMTASEVSCPDYLKPYMAELAANLGGEDIELCAACVRNGSGFINDPARTLKDILEKMRRSDGRSFGAMPDEAAVDRKIWETQLKIIFPIVENYRSYFTERYENQISWYLPIQNSSGEEYKEAIEVEIGTLHYMVAAGKIRVDRQESERLFCFKEIRNRLAHLKILDFEQINTILGGT